MKTLILLILFSSTAMAGVCSKNPIFCQIKKNQPNINKKYAMRLSNLIHKMHKKYHIPSRIFTAILKQESGYSLKAKGKKCGYTKLGKKECVYTDYGISQIHWKSVELWKFDLKRLTTDLEYSVEAGAIILADVMKRFEAKDINWYTRYNCGFRGTTKRDTCQIYKKLVERYF